MGALALDELTWPEVRAALVAPTVRVGCSTDLIVDGVRPR